MGERNQIDPALLELFRAEMDTHIPVLNDGLLTLEKGSAGEADFAALMRAAHSIKGAARIVGIEPAVRLAHVMEDCFTGAKTQRIQLSSEAVDILLQGVDALQRICAPEPDAELTDADLAALQERLTALKDGRLPEPVAEPPAATPALAAVVPARAADTPAVAPGVAPARPAGAIWLELPVEFDDASAEAVRRELCAGLSRGAPQIQLDFARVRGMSAGALALLAALVRDVARMEPAPALLASGAAGEVATLLRLAGLDRAWTAGD